jgi:hypothetical protein
MKNKSPIIILSIILFLLFIGLLYSITYNSINLLDRNTSEDAEQEKFFLMQKQKTYDSFLTLTIIILTIFMVGLGMLSFWGYNSLKKQITSEAKEEIGKLVSEINKKYNKKYDLMISSVETPFNQLRFDFLTLKERVNILFKSLNLNLNKRDSIQLNENNINSNSFEEENVFD